MLTTRFLFRWGLAIAPMTALLATCTARPLQAFDKRTCAASYESAQLYRHQQKLRKAREQLAICAHSTCPSVVSADCTAWLKEVDAAIPTMLFRVRDERGRVVPDFRVVVDGELVARDADSPFPFDPGPHLVRIEAEALAPLEQNIVIRAGERGRLLESTLLLTRREALDAEPPADRGREPSKAEGRVPERASAERTTAERTTAERANETKPAPEAPRTEALSVRETAMYVSGGVGLLALAAGTILGLKGTGEVDDMRATCAPECAKDDVDAARTKIVAANVSFGVGIGALAIAGILFINAPDPPKPSTGRARFLGLGVRPSPFGGGAEVVTTFTAP